MRYRRVILCAAFAASLGVIVGCTAQELRRSADSSRGVTVVADSALSMLAPPLAHLTSAADAIAEKADEIAATRSPGHESDNLDLGEWGLIVSAALNGILGGSVVKRKLKKQPA